MSEISENTCNIQTQMKDGWLSLNQWINTLFYFTYWLTWLYISENQMSPLSAFSPKHEKTEIKPWCCGLVLVRDIGIVGDTCDGTCEARGSSRYVLGWGGAARPLIPWPCLRQKSQIFPTLFKTEFRFFDTLFKTFVEHTCRLFIVQEKIPCLRQKLIKSIPWLRQKMIKSIPC